MTVPEGLTAPEHKYHASLGEGGPTASCGVHDGSSPSVQMRQAPLLVQPEQGPAWH